jgi:hypothetical protein
LDFREWNKLDEIEVGDRVVFCRHGKKFEGIVKSVDEKTIEIDDKSIKKVKMIEGRK